MCKKFLAKYENLNYDPYSNGEEFILRALADQGLRCIFDVGACVGRWALMAHSIFPGASVHCFEIVPSNIAKLSQNVSRFPNIIVNGCGLSDNEGVVKVRYFPDHPSLSTTTEYPHDLEHLVTYGNVITGDSYVQRHRIVQVNFLKVDVEGAEHLVFGGLSRTIREGKIDVIQFEYGKVNILTKFLLRDIYEFLQNNGYVVGKIYPNYVDFRDYDLSHEDFYGPNYLAVRKEHHGLTKLLA
jgi:FkbM family methyltransferase